jgi:arginyl-tRNA synthetase
VSRASDVLSPRVASALIRAFGADHEHTDPVVRASQFADLQVNAALALARRLGRPPREVAGTLKDALDVADIAAEVAISGPGFLNVTLREDWIAAEASALLADARLGVPIEEHQRVPIDYSAPNVAKEMHVGHLRTTVVGDCLARVLEHLGHTVIRQNHIGDWGTPFGLLIEHLLDVGEGSAEAALLESDPNAFYQAARAKFEAADGFADRSRRRVVALQAGDEQTLTLWRRLIASSTVYFNRIYRMLDVTLTDEDLAGESSYNDMLAGICEELTAAGLAVVSDGALCVFPDGFTGRDGKPTPLIIRKSDGGYGYATTDLATIRYRVDALRADRILYVIGAPQQLHLQMVFATARAAGWLPDDVTPVHVRIGNVLGPDGKILKTRSGNPIRLMALLDEAVQRADRVLAGSRPDFDAATRAGVAWQVGIGAVKYADLSVAHDSEYSFDFDNMLALTGNTGPYLQYATARIRSIFRKAGGDPAHECGPIDIGLAHERALALTLLDFGSVVRDVGTLLEPHRLCGYLFDVAQAFTAFYENCPVLTAPDARTRASRLALSALALRILATGLGLLGLGAPEQM